MLNGLLEKYITIKIVRQYNNPVFDISETPELIEILEEIRPVMHTWVRSGESPKIIGSHAIYATYDMFQAKIGGAEPALLCYYFCTLEMRKSYQDYMAHLFRAKIVFQNLKSWDNLIYYAYTTKHGCYEGNLDGDAFVDFLVLCDVYKAWDYNSDDSSFVDSVFENLKKQTPKVEALHPSYSKYEIIYEGELAHKALFNYVVKILGI